MLERLQLVNFQAHADTKIRFGQVTTIVGATDIGKSSILRALRWVLLNKPTGINAIRTGAKAARVTLWIDGRRIRRGRSASKNTYQLDEEKYAAFKNEPPDTVRDFAQVTELNFQRQIDGPFWLDQAPGQISKNLNAIFDLAEIDTALAYLGSEKNEARVAAKVARLRAEAAVADAVGYAWVDGAADQLRGVIAARKAASAAKARRDGLAGLLSGLVGLSDTIKTSGSLATDAAALANLADKANAARCRADALADLIGRASALAKARTPDTAGLDAAYAAWIDAAGRRDGLAALRADYENKTIEVDRLERAAVSAEEALHSKTEGVCPICQKPMDPPNRERA